MGANLARFLGFKFAPLRANTDTPDGKVIMSRTFKDAVVPENYELFYETYIRLTIRPVQYWLGKWRQGLKYKVIEEEDTEDGTHTLKVKYVLDGKKMEALHEAGWGNEDNIFKGLFYPEGWEKGQDIVIYDIDCIIKKEARTFDSRIYKVPYIDGAERVLSGSHVTTVLEPMQLSSYQQDPEHGRCAGDFWAIAITPFVEALGRDMCRKVRMHLDEEKHVVSTIDPIDKHIPYKKFFDRYVQSLKDAPKLWGLTIVSEAEDKGVTVVTYNTKGDDTEAGFTVISADESTGYIIEETNYDSHPVAKQVRRHIQIDKDPLSYKTWMENPDDPDGAHRYWPDEMFFYEMEKLEIILTSGYLSWLLG